MERKNQIEKMLTTANCCFLRFNAVNGNAVMNKIEKITDYEKNYNLKTPIDLNKFNSLDSSRYGMLGCKFSHYLNLRRIENTELTNRPVLILEDDVDLECDFVDKIEDAIQKLPENWDMCLITGFRHLHDNHVDFGDNSIIKVGYFFECLGYIVNGSKSAGKLANFINETCPPDFPVDLFLANISMQNGFNLYGLNNTLATQLRKEFPTAIPSSGEIQEITLVDSLNKYYRKCIAGINN